MDNPVLREQLRQLERRQSLILVLVGLPYLYLVADSIGFARGRVLFAIDGVLIVGLVIAHGRRNRIDVNR